MDLRECLAAGVLVEFLEDQERVVARAVFEGWRGRPLPAVGDTLVCPVKPPGAHQARSWRGVVMARHFEVQTDEQGCPVVWVRLEVRQRRQAARHRDPISFSNN